MTQYIERLPKLDASVAIYAKDFVCPCVGQVATNSKLVAYFLYHRWNRFACKHLDNGYTIAVQLMKRTKGYPYTESHYEAIKR